MSPRIQGTTGEAMNALHAISRTIGEMSEIATGIAGAMEQQSATTQETASNSGQAASGTQEVTAAIVGLTEASGAVGASAGEVLGDADGLSQQSDRLREQMQQFLARVRAA
jgi:methyl-accepting chemotaxis protein